MSDETKDDFVKIYWYWKSDGKRHFRIRGYGNQYDEVWKYLHACKSCVGSSDFPWSFWHFNEEEYEEERIFFGKFPDIIEQDTK